MTTRDLIKTIRSHANGWPAFNAVLESAANQIEEFMGGPVEKGESAEETKPAPEYVASGCAVYTADDWHNGTNRGGKIVASTALHLIDSDAADAGVDDSEIDFAETVANALNQAPTLLASNERLAGEVAELRHALTEMMRQFEPADPGADDGISDCDAIVLARAALASTGREGAE